MSSSITKDEIGIPDDSDLATPLLDHNSLNEGEATTTTVTLHGQTIDSTSTLLLAAEEVRNEARRVLDAASFAEKETRKSLGTPPRSVERKRRTDRSLSLEGRTSCNASNSALKKAAISLSNKGWKLYHRLKDKLNKSDMEDVSQDDVSYSA